MIDFLALPALACAALVGIHAYFGLQVLKRQVIFVDLALAQVAALGATIAFMLGHSPLSLASHAYALVFTLATAALLLVDRAPQGAEHIRQILTGNILTVGWDELKWAIPLYALVGVVHPLI